MLFCRNYEHIVKAHQNTPQHGQNQVSDEVKFQVVSVHACVRNTDAKNTEACAVRFQARNTDARILCMRRAVPSKKYRR